MDVFAKTDGFLEQDGLMAPKQFGHLMILVVCGRTQTVLIGFPLHYLCFFFFGCLTRRHTFTNALRALGRAFGETLFYHLDAAKRPM